MRESKVVGVDEFNDWCDVDVPSKGIVGENGDAEIIEIIITTISITW